MHRFCLWLALWCWGLIGLGAAAPPKDPLTLSRMRAMAQQPLQSQQRYLRELRAATPVLRRQGRLVQTPQGLPAVVIPDLHAQRDYLLQVLEMPLEGGTVFELLRRGQVVVVCLGDGMHSEGRALSRWLQAELDLTSGRASPAMEAELAESFGLMTMVMELKGAFPGHFFFVRGNHEDIDPVAPYRKFTRAGESNLVKQWVLQRFGVDFLKEWGAFESALPLVALGKGFVASHSPPGQPITAESVKSGDNAAFRACTWSDNTTWVRNGPEEQIFEDNCRRFGATSTRPWICGHRKVEGALFRSQCGGKLVQINPLDSAPRVVAVFYPGAAFRPAKNVIKLNKLPARPNAGISR